MYKGGTMVELYKGKGALQDATAYRGVLLASSCAKVLHGWCRARLKPVASLSCVPEQLGGFSGQRTATANHALRIHTTLARHRHLSCGIFFVDIKGAFHGLLREYVFTRSNDFTAQDLEDFLGHDHHDLSRLRGALEAAIRTNQCHLPEGLRSLLHDLHRHTWYWHPSGHGHQPAPNVAWTRRGSRPGSPIADMAFNLLMGHIIHAIKEALDDLPLYRAGWCLHPAPFTGVAWMDDLALPVVAPSATDLPDLLRQVVACVHTIFSQYGLQVNFAKGKSEIVMMFRGPQAEQMHRAHFQPEVEPSLVVSTDSHVLSVRITPTYRHLGIIYNMEGDLTTEVNARLGMATQAFAELARPIFCNRHLPVKVRVSLLESLVISRLLYGSATWSDLTFAQMKRLEHCLLAFQRRIVNNGFWSDRCLDDATLRHRFGLQPFRLILSRLRLGQLHHIATQAPAFYRHLLLAEYELRQGWLWETQHDLQWFQRLAPVDLHLPTTEQWDWLPVLDTIANVPSWKKLVAVAVKKHLAQESLAFEVTYLHQQTYQALREAGFDFAPEETADMDLEPVPPTDCFPCEHCDRTFPSKQSLAAHNFKQHAIPSVEWQYVQSPVCPGCLRNFWTSRRLQQHLRYRRNRCFDRVHGTRDHVDGVSVQLDPQYRNVKRLQVFRNVHGPLRPTPAQRARAVLLGDLSVTAWHHFGCGPLGLCQLTSSWTPCWTSLYALLQQSIEMESMELDSLHSRCLEVLQLHIDDDGSATICYLGWLWQHLVRGMEPSALLPFTCLAADLEDWHFCQCLDRTCQALACAEGEPSFPILPRREAQGYVDRRHPLTLRFRSLQTDEAARRTWKLRSSTFIPRDLASSYRLVIHLFSGRRRVGDYQHFAEIMLKGVQGYIIMSIDTAVSSSMNIFADRTWSFLWEAARTGHVYCLLMGPPCESWSEARYMELRDSAGFKRRGPRPLRSYDELWGLPYLSIREYGQLHLGNQLLLRGLWLGILARWHQGKVVVEHPHVPEDPTRPSIWRSALIQHLCAAGLFHQHSIL
eukprot:Skav210876  [mRNA]  locus=scaffold1173:296523:299633:- [translate_table: standard]